MRFDVVAAAQEALVVLHARELIEVADQVQNDVQDALLWSLTHGRHELVKVLCPLVNDLYRFLYEDGAKNLKIIFDVKGYSYNRLKDYVQPLFGVGSSGSGHVDDSQVSQNRPRYDGNGSATLKRRRKLSVVPEQDFHAVNHFIGRAMLPKSATAIKVAFIGQEWEFDNELQHDSLRRKLQHSHAYLDLLVW